MQNKNKQINKINHSELLRTDFTQIQFDRIWIILQKTIVNMYLKKGQKGHLQLQEDCSTLRRYELHRGRCDR